MITYTWTIENLERQLTDGFVTTAHWRCTAEDGDVSASVYGTHGWADGEINIPYDELTAAEVLGWIWEQTEGWKAEIEANLSNQIDALKNPVTASGLPWASV
jgi:hypothetical protein